MINKRFPGIFVNFLVIMTMTACQPALPENPSSKTTDISTTSHDIVTGKQIGRAHV